MVEARRSQSGGLPNRGSPGPSVPEYADGPMYAFFTATIRVEVDLGSEEVTEVLVDDDTMVQPTLVLRSDGGRVTEFERDRVALITSRAEWPSWGYDSVRDGPDGKVGTGPNAPDRSQM